MGVKITKLNQVPYPDFKLMDVIDPEQFDANNERIAQKIDELVDGHNAQDDDNATMQTLLNNHKSSTDHDSRYYSKTELQPYLTGGDTVTREEVYTIVNANLGNGTFTYKDKANVQYTDTITAEGYQRFTLRAGDYIVNENRLEIIVNDTLRRSVASGGIVELDGTHVALTQAEGAGAEITIKYFMRIGLMGEHAITHTEGGADVILVTENMLKSDLKTKINTASANAASAATSATSALSQIGAHTSDGTIHVTTTDKNNWNNKQNALNTDQIRKTTLSTSDPSGGTNGDIWIKYTP